MPTRLGESSQSWLAGTDNSLDNFFRSTTSSSSSTRGNNASNSSSGVKRKRHSIKESEVSKASKEGSAELPSKRSKTKTSTTLRISHTDECCSPSKATKGKGRAVFGDVTSVLQNSPHRRNRLRKSPKAKPTFKTRGLGPSSCKDAEANIASIIQIDDSSSSEDELFKNDVPPRLSGAASGKTPRSIAVLPRGKLPTPPPSSIQSSRRVVRREADSSPVSGKHEEHIGAQTPFLDTSVPPKQRYPTPVSMAVPRFRFTAPSACGSSRPILADNLHLNSDATFSAFSHSQSESPSQTRNEEDIEDAIIRGNEDESNMYTVVPPSQTQYLHYSPTKKKRNNEFPILKMKPPSLTVIPSSQSQASQALPLLVSSQSTNLSPRKTRKPPPLFTFRSKLPDSTASGEEKRRSVLNFVVPTSQEDEREISILDDASSRLSQVLNDAESSGRTRLSSDSHRERDEDTRLASLDLHSEDTLRPVEDAAITTTKRHEERKPFDWRSQHETRRKESSVATGTGPFHSTSIRIINAMLDDLDRSCAPMSQIEGAATTTTESHGEREPFDWRSRHASETGRKDEVKSSAATGTGSSHSTSIRIIDAVLEDLDRSCAPMSQVEGAATTTTENQEGREPSDRLSQHETGRKDEAKPTIAGDTEPSQSTSIRIINAMLDDLDRLAEEAQMPLASVSQVLSLPPTPVSPFRKRRGRGHGEDLSPKYQRQETTPSDEDVGDEQFEAGRTRKPLFMQSSLTEADGSQWDEDPFASTNEAYLKHLGLHPVTCTQSTATQPDEDDEDPFPTLPPPPLPPPPASTAESVEDRACVRKLLGGEDEVSQEGEEFGRQGREGEFSWEISESENEFAGGESQCESEFGETQTHGETPMPDIGSLDDPFDVRLLTPHGVRKVVRDRVGDGRSRSRFRRGDDRSFVFEFGEVSRDGGGDEEGEEEEIPSVVREFLSMFDSQSQSQT